MTKRNTIGANPLDAVVPDPMASPKPGKAGAVKAKPVSQKSGKSPGKSQAVSGSLSVDASVSAQDKAKQAGDKPEATPAKPPQAGIEAALCARVETLEQQNQCMRWLVGAVLAPLALLALLL
jgi:hypothetical protein